MTDESNYANKAAAPGAVKMVMLPLGFSTEERPEPSTKREAILATAEDAIVTAAREVIIAQEIGTALPFIVVEVCACIEDDQPDSFVKEANYGINVMGDRLSEKLKLLVKEAGYVAPGSSPVCHPREIACFEGGAAQWRKTLREWRNAAPKRLARKSDWDILTDILSDIPENDYAEIAAEIRRKLVLTGWIKEIEKDELPSGEEMLRELIQRRDVIPATMLLHSVLHELARDPIENARQMVDLCDFVGLSADSEKYRSATLCGMEALSKATNKMRFSRASMVVHQLLRQRGNHQCFPGFIHKAKPRAASEFL